MIDNNLKLFTKEFEKLKQELISELGDGEMILGPHWDIN
jgi:hypothetical protein